MKSTAARWILAACVIAVLPGFCVFSQATGGAPGTANDPIITLSYIESVFTPSVMNTLADKSGASFGVKAGLCISTLQYLYKNGLSTVSMDNAADTASDKAITLLEKQNKVYRQASKPVNVTLRLGDVVLFKSGTSVFVHNGQLRTQSGGGKLANLTLGQELPVNKDIYPNVRLIAYDDGSGARAIMDTKLTIHGSYRIISYLPKYTELAAGLKTMGLFNGTERGFELNRPASRLEGLVMMIRLLGEEQAALGFTGSCPFADVPDWGKKYVAYAYSKQYTKGVSASAFDPDAQITPEQYITFILRSMGYGDSDFTWDKSPDFAVQKGIYSNSDITLVRQPFYRDQVVYLSYYALDGKLKNGNKLIDRLISYGAVKAS